MEYPLPRFWSVVPSPQLTIEQLKESTVNLGIFFFGSGVLPGDEFRTELSVVIIFVTFSRVREFVGTVSTGTSMLALSTLAGRRLTLPSSRLIRRRRTGGRLSSISSIGWYSSSSGNSVCVVGHSVVVRKGDSDSLQVLVVELGDVLRL